MILNFEIETVPLGLLKPHPRNYVTHPQDELDHIKESLQQHGFYKNVVVANDYTIIAGHGVCEAARQLNYIEIPVRKINIDSDSSEALKILAGDNEIAHLREIDDRALSEILRDINEQDPSGLRGTGYDDMMLANLVLISRPASEIQDFDEAAHWVGMPDYEPVLPQQRITVSFRNEEDRTAFCELIGIDATDRTKSAWFPPKENDDVRNVSFEQE